MCSTEITFISIHGLIKHNKVICAYCEQIKGQYMVKTLLVKINVSYVIVYHWLSTTGFLVIEMITRYKLQKQNRTLSVDERPSKVTLSSNCAWKR